ncbi:hypothetical protein [Breoghania sp.]|uniref:hypothetical protein n=1 Tax=Breoghania sp. TaxID=2065378 RepID=UPI0029C9E221|nr:hypothetical protein [Breoghania sp.]
MARINKTLEYRRARFLDDNQNLEELLRNAWQDFGTQLERTVTSSDNRSTCGLQSRDYGANGLAIHCARFTDGQSVGTIPTAPAPIAAIGERQPEPGENFLNSDLLALIRSNHVICMNCGRNAGSLRIYLQKLFQKAGLHDASQNFELIRIGSPDKLALIDAVGVKSVDLKVDISEATATEVLEGDADGGLWHNIKSDFGNAINSVFGRDRSFVQLRNAEQGSVKITVNVPKGDLQVVKDSLDGFAEKVVEDEEADTFTIHLRDGAIIRPDEVSVKKVVKLETMANSVSTLDAWNEMNVYMRDLEESGQLEA